MLFLIVIVIMAVFAVVGYKMAESRNKDPVTWAVLCGLTGLIGVLILAATGEAKVQPTPYKPIGIRNDTASATLRHVDEPVNPSAPYDKKKWVTLKEVDPDIRSAAASVSALGVEYEAELAEKYLVLGNKGYLDAIVGSIKERAANKAEELRQIEQSSQAMSSEKSANAYKTFMATLAENAGVDPRTGLNVTSVEEFFGDKATGWHGGLKVAFADGSVQIREGGRTRIFKTQEEADSWGGQQSFSSHQA